MAVSLRRLLMIPFVLQVLAITGLVGYLSYRSGQRAVQAMAYQLMEEMDHRVSAQLATALQLPHTLTQMNAQIIATDLPQADGLDRLEDHFRKQIQAFPQVTTLAVTTPTGDTLEVLRPPQGEPITRYRSLLEPDRPFPRDPGERSQTTRLDLIPDSPLVLPPAADSWYRQIQARQGFWQPMAALHCVADSPCVAMVWFQPVYDQRGVFSGISSAGVLLSELSQVLQQVMGQREGQVILLRTNGNLVATSTGETVLSAPPVGDLGPDAPSQYRLLPWTDSEHALTRAAVQQLMDSHVQLSHLKDSTFTTFRFNSQAYFLHASPLDGELHWLTVTVMPSQAFMADISANLRRTLLFCVMALMGSIGLGIWTAETIAKPILALQRATEAFAQEATFLPPGQPSHIQEVDALRQRFDDMVRQLVHSLQTLRHREDTLAIFLDGVPVGISVHGPDGQMLFLNHKGQQLLPDGILPSKLAELSEDYHLYRANTEEYYPVEDLPVARGLRGQPAHAEDLDLMVQGRRIPLEVHTIPVFDDQGQVRYCIAAFQDITERRQIETLRATYERQLEQRVAQQTASIARGNATKQALINAIPDLLIRLGKDGIPREIYNMDAVHWLGNKALAQQQSMYHGLPPALADQRRCAIEAALTTGNSQHQEYEIVVDGQTYWEEARIVPVTPDEVLVVVRDMSDRHRVDRLKDEFIAMVSHELRTPLTAMRGALGILESGVLQDRPDKAQQMLHVSLTNTDRLIRMVSDILDLERLASGQVKLAKQDYPAPLLVQQAIESVEALALGAHITLHSEVVPATVWVAPDKIVQTLVNLLSNAIKFSPADSHIWIRLTWHDPETVCFSVADQGRGIPADQQALIFDRFWQVDASDSRQGGGTGLGLAICKTIVTQHGGEIWVESTLEKGSTFFVTLPAQGYD
ncbi:MAG: ATP-binding protein [Leptolyngbya sp.]|nr:ATP-binding protein [Leptolyngbya sp.]